MSIYWFMPTLLLVGAGYFYLASSQRQKILAKDQLSTLRCIRTLVMLMEFLPKHRGASSAALKGESGFKAKLQTLQDKITQIINRIDSETKRNSSIKYIEEQWNDLHSSFGAIGSADNFNRHTLLISRVISQIKDLAEDSGLLRKDVYALSAVRDACFGRLLPVIELMGQARGLSTMQVSEGRNTTSSRIKLQYIVENIVNLWQDCNNKLMMGAGKNSTRIEEINQINELISAYMKVITLDIIAVQIIELDANVIFSQGTEVIDRLMNFYNELLDEIETEVVEAERVSSQGMNVSLGVFIVSFMPLTYLIGSVFFFS